MDWERQGELLNAFKQGGEAKGSPHSREKREEFLRNHGHDAEAVAWFDEGLNWSEEPNP